MRVARFADEVRLVPTASKLLRDTTVVRAAPRASDRLGELALGTEVTRISRSRDYYLVLFADPASSRLRGGWIHEDALDERAVTAPTHGIANAPFSCAGPTVRIQTDREFCAAPCGDDADCRRLGGGVCDGNGRPAGPGAAGRVQYCVAR